MVAHIDSVLLHRPVPRAALPDHEVQSDAHGDDIGGRKWGRLRTIVFIVAASAMMWLAIGYGLYRLVFR